MRKKARIIEIRGVRGLFMVAFVVSCLCAGFVFFPAKCAASAWNYVASNYIDLPLISLWQGLLLWAAVALSVYIVNSRTKMLSYKTVSALNEQEMKTLMERIKIQAEARRLNSMLMNDDELKKDDTKIENKDVSEKHS